MEIIIFKKNEITFDIFKNKDPFSIIKYTDISSLKNEEYGNFKDLDQTKARLDLLDRNAEKNRRAAAKYLHEYELVKVICKKQVISRAYFKLYEIIYFEQIILQETCDCFFICEAPGGFIECVTDIRRKKNLRTKYISISKYDQFIKYGNYFEENNLLYGDITDISILHRTIQTTQQRFPNGLDLITADGGFDVKIFIAQEIISSKLLLCEMYLALHTQKIGGTFVIKFFDMFTHNSIIYYLLLCSFYQYVKIIKPKTSRNCNSERYLVCYNFKGKNSLLHDIKNIIENFCINDSTFTLVYPTFDFKTISLSKLSIFNNLILYEQIKTINESIKMVNTKDTYFQNLLLGIFMEHKSPLILNKLHNILLFKNILFTRIKKCIEFLRTYNININQIQFN
jgi:23S rRNA U2552 (ribose-2'-O)-methylase RlmE/FtsJ